MLIAARDDDWIYLCKPAGLPVFPLHGLPDSDCLLKRLLEVDPRQADVLPADVDPAKWAGGILHRLDRGTSGLVVAARSPEAFLRGREAFTSHRLTKTYRFRSAADPPWSEHRIDAPLAHDRKKKSKMVWKRGAKTPHRGRWYPASTRFSRLATTPEHSSWEARMSTGVMHQIRVHAAAVGIPLLGDRLYGGAPDEGGRLWLHHLTIRDWPGGAPVVREDWT